MTAANGKGRIIADGKYELEDVIGEGGMGLVYVGRHVVLQRKIAVKVLHPEFVHRSDATDRFLKEARLVSQLRHQNTVQLLDFGTDGHEYWLVMEYLDGEDLAGLIAKSVKIPPLRALNIAIQLLAALGEAHDTGIVHCDLKPANIMVIPWHDDDGLGTELVKVLDFGIATLAEDSRPSKEVAGTPDYMSPEQAQGLGMEARSDLYAVGIMLHEMLTGQPPFSKGDAVKTMWAQVEEPAPLLRSLEPTLPESLEACLQKALAKTKEDRFPHARTFRTRLLEISDEMSGLGRRPTTKNDAVATVVGQGGAAREARPLSKAMWLVVGLALAASVGAFALALSNTGGTSGTETPTPATVALAIPAAPSLVLTAPEFGSDVTGSSPSNIVLAPTPEGDALVGLEDKGPSSAEADTGATGDGSVGPEDPEDSVLGAAAGPEGTTVASSSLASTDKPVPTQPRVKEPATRDIAGKPVPAVKGNGPTAPNPTPADPDSSAVAVKPDAVAAPRDVTPPKDPEPTPPEITPPVAQVVPSLEARAGFAELSVQGSLPHSSVQRALDGAIQAVEGCYRDGARAAAKDAVGNLKVSFEVNVDGQLRNVVVQSFSLPGVTACVQSNLGRLRTRDRPDTGTVIATARLRFNPLPPLPPR